MIRRGFWLTAGAVTGIYGYRRACAAGRRVSAHLNPGAVRLAGEAIRFTRDVREGMELYRRAHPAGPALATDHDAQPEDGR